MAGSINRVVIVGNLTRDPELKTLPSGTSVCSMRVAVNDRAKDPTTGEWVDRPGYYNVTVFGQQAERYAEWFAKGRQVVVDGRLRWREWETQDGQKREAVEIVADFIQSFGPREGGGSYGGDFGGRQTGGAPFNDAGLKPAEGDFQEDDDIPF